MIIRAKEISAFVFAVLTVGMLFILTSKLIFLRAEVEELSRREPDVIEITKYIGVTEPKEEESNTNAELMSLGIFTVTAYCPCVECSGGYGRQTATGSLAKAKHTVAVDPEVISYGTTLIIDGEEYIAEDTGSAVKGSVIDIFFDTHKEVNAWGKRKIEVFQLIEEK